MHSEEVLDTLNGLTVHANRVHSIVHLARSGVEDDTRKSVVAKAKAKAKAAEKAAPAPAPARGRGGYHTQGHAEARRARPLTDVAHFSWSSSHEKSEQRAQNRYLLRQLPAKRTASQAPEFPIEATLNRTESLHFLPRSLLRLNVTLKMTSQTCHQLLTAFAGRCSSSPCF